MRKSRRESIVTGLEAIDRQHLKYLKIVNRAFRRVDRNLSPAGDVTALGVYVIDHFDCEEELMNRHRYPAALTWAHLQQHAWFQQRIWELGGQLERRRGVCDGDFRGQLEALLVTWTVRHILAYDRPLCRYLAEQGIPITADRRYALANVS